MFQPRRGYRYSVDAFALVGMALEGGVPRRALDLGTGCGVCAFLLAGHGIDTVGVEVMADWSSFWEASLEASVLQPELLLADVREVSLQADLVICNPPYTASGQGPVSTDPMKAAAHVEQHGELSDFVEAAVRCTTREGRMVFVLPEARTDELHRLTRALGWTPRRALRFGERRRVTECRLGAGEETVRRIPARGPDLDALVALARRTDGRTT